MDSIRTPAPAPSSFFVPPQLTGRTVLAEVFTGPLFTGAFTLPPLVVRGVLAFTGAGPVAVLAGPGFFFLLAMSSTTRAAPMRGKTILVQVKATKPVQQAGFCAVKCDSRFIFNRTG